ncbi:MAG: HlyD family efflux transporter periplasmic adaptor subunit [Patescibacteria group bacterium]|nr:HlyD family efflux transporter periplasmic adaptor subunit [Patescibacteria group bacterium]
MLSFLSKKIYIILTIILLAAAIGYWQYAKTNQTITYETVKVERGSLAQTVEATGKIESANDLSLRFETAGTLDVIKVKEGDEVKAGDLLANLRLADLNAAVAQAQANLNQKLAGATGEERDYYRAAADNALAALEQAKADASSSVTETESALETAKNNLKMAEGGESSRIVSSAYEDAVALLQAVLSILDDSITQSDNILGIDSIFANDSFETQLSINNISKLPLAQNNYYTAKEARNSARTAILSLTTLSDHKDIDDALIAAENALAKMNQLLVSVSDVLAATPQGSNLTQSALDTKKTTIETTRVSLTAKYTSVISQRQEILDAKNSYTTYNIAYEKAIKDLENTKASSASAIKVKEASYNQALANLQGKILPPREVDIAYYRAAFSQAIANRDKAIIRAPIDGIIAKVNKKRGEFISTSDIAVQMLTPFYEIKIDISETDVAKLKINDQTEITLDAFGEDVKFSGKILQIDPASTEIQDVVYYKVRVALDLSDKPIKSGMTANVTVNTEKRENILYVPLRAVRAGGETGKYVRVLENKTEKEVPVKLGLKADNGLVEITEGLTEGQEIILSVKTEK